MGAAGSAGPAPYRPLSVDDDEQRQRLAEFYDELEAEFGDDLTGAFVAPLSPTVSARNEPDLDEHARLCQAAVCLEPRLASLRYRLVPGRITESQFWKHFLLKYAEFEARLDVDRALPLSAPLMAAPMPQQSPPSKPLPTKSEPLTSEVVQALIPEVFVYRIPHRPEAQGHNAKDWKLDQPLWTGVLRVLSAGDFVVWLRLSERTTGTIFANSDFVDLAKICRESPSSRVARLAAIAFFIEPAVDSSRYFVVRFRNAISGQTALLGIGFRHRSMAFDLNASVLDQLSKCERHLNLLDAHAVLVPSRRRTDENEIEADNEDLILPDLDSLNDEIPPMLPPPRSPSPQLLYREGDDEDDDEFNQFVAACLP